MRWMVKLVLMFLIAWLPIAGFSTPALLCQHSASPVSTSPAGTAHMLNAMPSVHATAPDGGQHHQPVCQTSAGTASCTMLAIPSATIVTVPVTSSSTYALRNVPSASQFIPELPQRPPQAL